MNASAAGLAQASANRSQLFQRHDLVWLGAAAALHPVGAVWVIARRSADAVTQGLLALGACQPAAGGGKPLRMAAMAPVSAVQRWRPALCVAEVLHGGSGLPAGWQTTLQALLPLQAQFGILLRVFGSASWQVLAAPGACLVHAASDLDLLVCLSHPLPVGQLQALCQALDAISTASMAAGGPALDGELRLPGLGDVAWREWLTASARQDRLLVKDAVSVRLLDPWPVPEPLATPRSATVRLAGRGDRSPWQLDQWACAALREEALAWPKPGLVSAVDSGSHHDMDIHLLLRAIAALEGWFAEFARAAQAGAGFAELAALGRAAEAAMLEATGGVNAYRGAIFNLGLLAAAAAIVPEGDDVCAAVARFWAQDLLTHQPPADSHGQQVLRREGSGGALQHAAQGFPVLRTVVLPAYRRARAQGFTADRCVVAACLASMAVLDDTNLLWRGGAAGLHWARASARSFNERGGVARADWRVRLAHLHAAFVQRHLSPGGSADLAGCAAFLARLGQ